MSTYYFAPASCTRAAIDLDPQIGPLTTAPFTTEHEVATPCMTVVRASACIVVASWICTAGAPSTCVENRADPSLDQYYTRPHIAMYCYAIFGQHFDPHAVLMVEPSAGQGAFFRLLPPGSRAYDKDPRFPGIIKADFFNVQIRDDRQISFIGNPPFGRNASLAKRFFKHAAAQGHVIAWILPRTFCKISVQNELHPNFHLIREEPMPNDAFLFEGRPYDVPTVFQIWEHRRTKRAKWPEDVTHPDFTFISPDDRDFKNQVDFAIQRVGARAGLIHHDFDRGKTWNYFIKGDVEAIMRQLDFATVARNTAGNPSLAKAEIVLLYRAYVEGRGRLH